MVDRIQLQNELLKFAEPFLNNHSEANLKEQTATKKIYMSWNEGLPVL